MFVPPVARRPSTKSIASLRVSFVSGFARVPERDDARVVRDHVEHVAVVQPAEHLAQRGLRLLELDARHRARDVDARG